MNKNKIIDANKNNLSDRWLPKKFKPYFHLMRLDRPVGIWLVLWPCFWGQIIAIIELNSNNIPLFIPIIIYQTLMFIIGAIIMRSVGCVYNDLVDYKYDSQVERTRNRPLPLSIITMKQTKYLIFILLILGLIILIQFNWFTIFIGIISLILIIIYPWMKRLTYWSQAFLGITLNWGVILGYTSITNHLSFSVFFLYLASFFWTIGYDTIYAHQDIKDDVLIGIKSTAILFGNKTKFFLTIFYSLTIICLIISGIIIKFNITYVILCLFISLHLFWQIYRLDLNNQTICLKIFKSNIFFGGIITFILIIFLY